MERLKNMSVRLIVVLSLTLIGLLGVIQPTQAQGIISGDSVPAGTTVQSDVILYGDNVVVSGNVDGDVLAIGRKVTVDGEVSGSMVLGGENVTVNGPVGGTLYVGAANLELGEQADLNRNLYFAGLSLSTQEGSVVGRDLLAASLGATLAGEVNGSTKAIIGALEFIRIFMDNFGDSFSTYQSSLISSVPIRETVMIPASLGANSFAGIGISGLLSSVDISESVTYQQGGGVDWDQVEEWSVDRLRVLVTLFIFGLIGIWLIPKVITRSADKLREKPLPGTGFGLLALVIAFNLLGVVLLLFVIILAIGLFLGFATMWELAWAFMALGFFGLGLTATIFGLFVLYISKVIVAYLVGYVILNRFVPSVVRYKILSLLLGLVIYVLLVGIPILGWVIGLLVTALGLGAAWLYYRDRRELGNGEAEVLEAEE
jgi:cytoskeletal protein CcmA (bactofilin family)